ncbi:MAG: hypothetical protein Q8P18_01945 [Pseudomonadota bacterium]|nr:hypothetical protein [Pseudomonadota bacterium]
MLAFVTTMLAGCNDPPCDVGCGVFPPNPQTVACGAFASKDEPPCYCFHPWNYTCDNSSGVSLAFTLNRSTVLAMEGGPGRDEHIWVPGIEAALDSWDDVSAATLFLSSDDTSDVGAHDGVNVIYLTDDPTACGDDEAIGACADPWGEADGAEVTDCDIAFIDTLCDDSATCLNFDEDRIDLITMHEVGHCLGFAHNTIPTSIMQGSETLIGGLTELGESDALAAAYLYDAP